MEDQVVIRILFFAASKELAGIKETSLKVEKSISFERLKALIVNNYNLNTIANNFVLAVNQNYVEENQTLELSDHDEIAIIPPLSAG